MKKLNKVLLIDDSTASNVIHQELLYEMDIAEEIVLKEGASEALEYIKGNDNNDTPPVPDLILLDIEMPGKDGFDFLEEFNQLTSDQTNDFKIVIAMLSNHLDIDNFEKAKSFKMTGVVDHIRKPMYKEDIENLLEENFDW